MDLAKAIVREPDVSDASHYSRRVWQLATVYAALFAVAATGLVLLCWQGRLFVTLSQRSNVETLTIAFLLIFFLYLTVLTAPGAWGAFRISFWAIMARIGDRDAVERRKTRALGPPGDDLEAVLTHVIERRESPGKPIELRIADDIGLFALLRIEGVRLTHVAAYRSGSNELLGFVARQIAEITGERRLDVQYWGSLDDENLMTYDGLVEALERLKVSVGAEQAWRRVIVDESQCRAVEQRLSAICGALRNEAFLPHWEFAGEHKIPIIPEPLGIISLSRSERRVDPLASMGTALFVVAVVVAFIILFIVRPPWVPGS